MGTHTSASVDVSTVPATYTHIICCDVRHIVICAIMLASVPGLPRCARFSCAGAEHVEIEEGLGLAFPDFTLHN